MGPDIEGAWLATRQFLDLCEIPPFITGDIEGGGHGSAAMLQFPNQLGLAAAHEPDLSGRLLSAVCAEARVLGFNWSFTPVIDVNAAPRSAIVGTRSYGSDPRVIAEQAAVHVKVLQAHGIAATAKHWPGEGFDDRDQHLVTTINPLAMLEWHKIFGTLYQGLIDQGLLTVMSAHIALPAYLRAKGFEDGLELYRPASISKTLNFDLLRGELGFNGLIVSDATPMAGLTAFSDRATAVPEVIENGCDVFLFSPDEERDFRLMMKGLSEKRLSEQRLNDAVTRILGLKAALGLHRRSVEERIGPLEEVKRIVKSKAHLDVADEAARKSITLVKDVRNLIPITVQNNRRITLVDSGAPGMVPSMPRRPMVVFSEELKKRGFEIKGFDPQHPPSAENCDLLIYVFAVESSLGLSHIHIDWMADHQGFGEGMARYWHDVPTLMISFGHAYYLRDAPRVPAYVNAYSTIPAVQAAAAACMVGEIPFAGISPVEAFQGLPDAQY